MKDGDMEKVVVSETRPRGSVIYVLDGVADLHETWKERYDDEYNFDEKEVAKRVAEKWFKEDFPLCSVDKIIAEKVSDYHGPEWRVSIHHTSSTSIRSRTWSNDDE